MKDDKQRSESPPPDSIDVTEDQWSRCFCGALLQISKINLTSRRHCPVCKRLVRLSPVSLLCFQRPPVSVLVPLEWYSVANQGEESDVGVYICPRCLGLGVKGSGQSYACLAESNECGHVSSEQRFMLSLPPDLVAGLVKFWKRLEFKIDKSRDNGDRKFTTLRIVGLYLLKPKWAETEASSPTCFDMTSWKWQSTYLTYSRQKKARMRPEAEARVRKRALDLAKGQAKVDPQKVKSKPCSPFVGNTGSEFVKDLEYEPRIADSINSFASPRRLRPRVRVRPKNHNLYSTLSRRWRRVQTRLETKVTTPTPRWPLQLRGKTGKDALSDEETEYEIEIRRQEYEAV